jgi:excisionase family DNA binding protein
MINDELKIWLLNRIDLSHPYKVEEVIGPEMLNCTRRQIYSLIYRGEIKTIKVGKTYRIPGVSIWEYLKKQLEENQK